jgi:hypothetical protein
LDQSAPRRPASGRSKRWLAVAGWSLLGLLGATLLVFIATVTFGAVHGTEFCPQTFERRSYSYYELPVFGIQLTGERNEDLTGPTELEITSQKYVAPHTGAKKDWHVLVGSRGTSVRRPGNAGILMMYLDAMDSESYHRWVGWSEAHQQQAHFLWPAVQRLAVHELYVDVPDLFDLAKLIDYPQELEQKLNQTVAARLLVLGRRLQGREDQVAAVGVLDEALALDPMNTEIREARAEVRAESTDQSPGHP